MTNKNLTKLIEQIVDEETAKLEFPWKKWTLNKENSLEFMHLFKKGSTKFIYNPDGIVAKEVSPEDGSGIWQPVQATQYNTPITKNSIISLDYDQKRFFIETNLNDPRIAYIIKSTIDVFPNLSDYLVSRIKWEDEAESYQQVNFEDYGSAQDLVSKIKISKGTFSAYKSSFDEEDRFEQFEFLVFKDLNEETWYHATKESNVNSILEKGLVPSGTYEQGTGWTQFNTKLQNAVYMTRNITYARKIAETLSNRFDENAVVIGIDGSALKDFSKIITDEDVLRDKYDGSVVRSWGAEDFIKYKTRIPEVIESITDEISSIGYKDIIAPEYLHIEDILEADNIEIPTEN